MISWQEKDIEDYLWSNPDQQMGFYKISEWVGRQVHVPSGIIDLLGIANGKFPVVIEIKNVAPQSEHLTQVCRYASDVTSILTEEYDRIVKVLIFPDVPFDNRIVFEAEALGVWMIPFSVGIDLRISGHTTWSAEYRQKLTETYTVLSECEPFAKLRGAIMADEILTETSREHKDEQSPPNIE